jgi:hypothetical protein
MEFGINKEKEKIMKNNVNSFKQIAIFSVAVFLAILFILSIPAAAKKPWDGVVHAPLKTVKPFDWSAPDEFFTGKERGKIKFFHANGRFEGVLELARFKQAGPYVLTVDTGDGSEMAGYGCDIWNPWAQVYGETFPGGTNGCWEDIPYGDVMLFYLDQYDSNRSGGIDENDYYGGTIQFDLPLLNGTYNIKFFLKLDYRLTSPYSNIMMMNNMDGYRKYGQVTKPKGFDYNEDLIIQDSLGAEKLVLADSAWCEPDCEPPSSDPGYMDTTGVVFYSALAQTFEGVVVLSNTVTPATPQPLQIKLEGLGSLSDDADSNEALGSIGRWWDNDGPGGTANNISDSNYEAVKDTHDVLGYVVFDGFDTAGTLKAFALDTSYHVLWTPQSGRPAPGSVVMPAGDYVAYFALTENISWWRGVFLSENPLEFTISD